MINIKDIDGFKPKKDHIKNVSLPINPHDLMDFSEWLYNEKRIPTSEFNGWDNQQFIGYMIEYCIENNIRFEVSSNYHKSIDKAYNYLLRKIS
jgi:hypothetical protein